jgi:hypothetical protein
MGFTAATFCFCAHMCFSFNCIVNFFFSRTRCLSSVFFFRYNSLYFVLVLFMYCLTNCLCKCLCECDVFVHFFASLLIAQTYLSSIITILFLLRLRKAGGLLFCEFLLLRYRFEMSNGGTI